MTRRSTPTIKAGFFAFLCGLAISQPIGCADSTSDIRINGTCRDYCEAAHDCNDDVDVDDCRSDCENTIGDCMADEQDHALDDLDSCAEDSCDDFAACTIGAGLQCTFGI